MRISKLLGLTIVSLFLSVLMTSVAGAQRQIPNGQLLIFGQTQAYDVLLRGNGEAVVNARLTVTNTDASPLYQLKYQVSGANLTEAAAIQEVDQAHCYTQPVDSTTKTSQSSNSTSANGTPPTTSLAVPPQTPNQCIDPLQTSQNNSYGSYPYQQPVYKKADVSRNGQEVTVTLAEPITTNQSSTIVFAYAASGYAKSRLGSYQFAFQTLKSDSRTNSVTVAVSVDEGFQLAHANSNVNYKPSSTAQNLSSELSAGTALSADSSANIASYVQGIGSNGQILKTASQLAAQETLTVKGTYAASWWRLHVIGLIEWLILVLLLIVGTFLYVIKKRRRNNSSPPDNQNPTPPVPSLANQTDEVVVSQPEVVASKVAGASAWWHNLPFAGIVKRVYWHFAERRVRPLFMGMFCGILIIVLLVVGIGVAWQLSNMQTYSSYNTSVWLTLSVIVAILAGVLLFAVVGFGLPILYGHTKGVKMIVKILVYEALFFLFILIALAGLAFIFRDTSSTVTPNVDCGGITQSAYCGSHP